MKNGHLFNCSIIVLILSSCGARPLQQLHSYDPSLYRQLWTADWSPDQKFIAVGGVDSTLRILDPKSLLPIKEINLNSWIHVVKWHPSKKLLAIATLDQYILLLNTNNYTLTHLPGIGGSRAIDWSHDGRFLAVGDLDGNLSIWDDAGTLLKEIQMQYSEEEIGKSFLGLNWNPQKNQFVAINNKINIVDTSGILRQWEHVNKAAIMLCVNWHPSGESLVIGDYGHNWEGENVPSLLHFWSRNGTLLRQVTGSKGEYRNIAWNHDGTRIATASDVLRIWDKHGNLLFESPPDSINYLWGIDWSPSGKQIVTSSRFKKVSLWNAKAVLERSVIIQ